MRRMSTFDDNTVNAYYFAEGSINHMDWGFSAPGIHKVRLRASAFAGPGETNPTGPSETFTITFAIGPLAYWQAENFTASGNAGSRFRAGGLDRSVRRATISAFHEDCGSPRSK
jgi:surface-anchored protein